MKSLIAILAFLCLISPALAGENELTFSGSYVRQDNGDSFWSASGEYLLGLKRVAIGPEFAVTEGEGQKNDRLLAGLAGEFNLGGPDSGLFVGGDALYDYNAAEGLDDYQIAARLGIKKFAGKALFKGRVRYVLDGFGDNGDIEATAVFGWRL